MQECQSQNLFLTIQEPSNPSQQQQPTNPHTRPQTHDLLVNIIESLNSQIIEVCITDIQDKTYFAEITLLTDGKGVPVVYDGVGKDTLEGSLECLKTRGMMVSFGNASGPLSDINVPKMLQPKGLFFVRPSM